MLIPDGTPPPEASNPITDYVPVARPGSRAPHVWLERDGTCLSTLDLFGSGFTLLAGAEGKAWHDSARALAAALGVPLEAYTIGSGGDLGDLDERWSVAYGVGRQGAVLVRPDGYVAWRRPSGATDPSAELEAVFRVVRAEGPAPALSRPGSA